MIVCFGRAPTRQVVGLLLCGFIGLLYIAPNFPADAYQFVVTFLYEGKIYDYIRPPAPRTAQA